ncbi:MAG: P-type conjugative transfer protein TrbL [Lentisphaerae bacterium]|nr:P-type conjugative transfer protein TrbL [Lentisphaerota bacterium]
MKTDFGILNKILKLLTTNIARGYDFLIDDAMYLLSFFVVIDMVVLGILWALDKKEMVVTGIMKVTTIGMYIYLITESRTFSRSILDSFGMLGIKAGGDGISPSILLDPSKIATLGLKTTYPIIDSLAFSWTNPGIYLFTLIALFIGMIAFFIIAINIMLCVIEFYFFSVLSVILIPFGMFKPLAFLCERAISSCLAIGIKYMGIAMTFSITWHFLNKNFILPKHPDLPTSIAFAVGSLTLAYISLHIPKMITSFIGGANASFGIGEFASSMKGGQQNAGKAASTATAAAKPALAALSAAGKAIGKSLGYNKNQNSSGASSIQSFKERASK